MNTVTLMGRLTRDPDMRHTQGATPMDIARFSVAIDRRKKTGEQPQTDFIPCVAFNKTAEIAAKYLHKGNRVLVRGRLQSNSYQGSDGKNHTSYEVAIDELEFIERANANAEAPATAPAPADAPAAPFANANNGFSIPEDDELPFA